MSTELTHRCTSTSTMDLQSSSMNRIDSSSQTIIDNHEEKSWISYEEFDLRPTSNRRDNRKMTKRTDQMTLCRIRQYSVGCWTKPARLMQKEKF